MNNRRLSALYKGFASDARGVIARAEKECRRLNHGYLGTEHVLLALLDCGGLVAEALKSVNMDVNAVRLEIEGQAEPGPTATTAAAPPLTPRAIRVLELAAEEAGRMNQKNVHSEHLLLGLLREPDGVAGQVLRNMGLSLRQAWQEVMKIRLVQLEVVERAVRPVDATIARKRKMREELLAHLTVIYEDERTRLNDAAAAMSQAVRRFGDPAALSGEFNRAMTPSQRLAYHVERWFAWRFPESSLCDPVGHSDSFLRRCSLWQSPALLGSVPGWI